MGARTFVFSRHFVASAALENASLVVLFVLLWARRGKMLIFYMDLNAIVSIPSVLIGSELTVRTFVPCTFSTKRRSKVTHAQVVTVSLRMLFLKHDVILLYTLL